MKNTDEHYADRMFTFCNLIFGFLRSQKYGNGTQKHRGQAQRKSNRAAGIETQYNAIKY